MRTAWLYCGGNPIQSVRMTEEIRTEADVRRKMLADLDSCPGVFCNYPHEAPFERRIKIHHCPIKYFPN